MERERKKEAGAWGCSWSKRRGRERLTFDKKGVPHDLISRVTLQTQEVYSMDRHASAKDVLFQIVAVERERESERESERERERERERESRTNDYANRVSWAIHTKTKSRYARRRH